MALHFGITNWLCAFPEGKETQRNDDAWTRFFIAKRKNILGKKPWLLATFGKETLRNGDTWMRFFIAKRKNILGKKPWLYILALWPFQRQRDAAKWRRVDAIIHCKEENILGRSHGSKSWDYPSHQT